MQANSSKPFSAKAKKDAPPLRQNPREDDAATGPHAGCHFETAAPASYERAVYRPSRRSAPFALIASASTMLAILAGIMTLNVISQHKAQPRLTVMTMRELDTRTKAPPQPEKLETAVETPSPAFVPKPKIELPLPRPAQIVLDAPPLPAPVAKVAAPAPVSTTRAAPSTSAPQDGGDLAGKALFIKPPVYPVEARRRHEQGTVKLLVLVSANGTVDDIEVASSSGSRALDHAALKAVKRWRWEPVTRNGAATAVRGYVVIPFVLETKDA
jgi:protein TonB